MRRLPVRSVDVNQSAETHESLEKSIRRGRRESALFMKCQSLFNDAQEL